MASTTSVALSSSSWTAVVTDTSASVTIQSRAANCALYVGDAAPSGTVAALTLFQDQSITFTGALVWAKGTGTLTVVSV